MYQYSKILPNIHITEQSKCGNVKYKQTLGSFMELKLGEKVRYANYEVIKGIGLRGVNEGYVRGKARIHEIDYFESVSSYINFNSDKRRGVIIDIQ